MPSNMSLVVNVTLSGSQSQRGGWSITKSYAQGPTIPASSNVVNEHGDITLANMAKTADYNNATQITFVLDASQVRDAQGNPARVRFPSFANGAIAITPAPGLEIAGMQEDPNGGTLGFLDNDDNGASYNYTLYVVCSAQGSSSGTIVPLDPRLVNRPVS